MFRVICFHCRKELEARDDGAAAEQVSHGVCEACLPRLFAGGGQSFAAFLEALPAPVLVVNAAYRVLGGNARARALVPDGLRNAQGQLCGEAFECAHCREPGGCGETVHCRTCAIRRAVTETFATGAPCVRVPACVDLGDLMNRRSVRYLISTERAGAVVLLRIDDVAPA